MRREEDQKRKLELARARQIRQRAKEIGLLDNPLYRMPTVEELYKMTIDLESLPPHKRKVLSGYHRTIALHFCWLRNRTTRPEKQEVAERIVADEWQISSSLVHHCVLEHAEGLGNEVAAFVHDPDQFAVAGHFSLMASQFKKLAE
jgi:hypothetical protein